MSDYIKDFIETFNECYPFERYILKTSYKINYLYDDAFLTEVFIPSTKTEAVTENGKLIYFKDIDKDTIYIKVKGPAGVMRFSLFDFNDEIRESIIAAIIDDFDSINWQNLYCDSEDDEDEVELKKALLFQKSLIVEQYGDEAGQIKDNCEVEKIINILNND